MGNRRKSSTTVARTKRGAAPRRPSLPQMLARMSTRECARKAAHAGKLKEALVRLRTELQAIDADVAAVRVRDANGSDAALGVDDAPLAGPPGFPPLAAASPQPAAAAPGEPLPQPQLMSYIDAVLTLPPRTPSAPSLPARRPSNAKLASSRSQMPLQAAVSSPQPQQQAPTASAAAQRVPAPKTTAASTPAVGRSAPAALPRLPAAACTTPRQPAAPVAAPPSTPRQASVAAPPSTPTQAATPPPLPRRASIHTVERRGSVMGSRALEDAKSMLATALTQPGPAPASAPLRPAAAAARASASAARAPRAPFGAGNAASFNRNGTTLSFAEWAHGAADAGHAYHAAALARAKTVAPYDPQTHAYRTADSNVQLRPMPQPQGRRTPLAPRNAPAQPPQRYVQHHAPQRYVQQHPHPSQHAHTRQPSHLRAPQHVYTRAASALAAGRPQVHLPRVQGGGAATQGQGAPQALRRPCAASSSQQGGVPALVVSDAAGAPLRWAPQ